MRKMTNIIYFLLKLFIISYKSLAISSKSNQTFNFYFSQICIRFKYTIKSLRAYIQSLKKLYFQILNLHNIAYSI